MKYLFLVLFCVRGYYGENDRINTVQESENSVITFSVSITGENAHCHSTKKELTIEEGRRVVLNVSPVPIPSAQKENGNMLTQVKKVKCSYFNDLGKHDLGEEYDLHGPWREELTVTRDMFGLWSCKLKYNENTQLGEIKPVEHERSYSYVICNFTVKNSDRKNLKPESKARAINMRSEAFFTIARDVSSTTPVPLESKSKMPMDAKIWYCIGGGGILVLLIIIGQTIALCYFRRKAQPRRRMDDMTTCSRFERGDRARYSAPPSKKGKSSPKAEADRDSHIYEMVGVNALYNKSSDLDPEATNTVERDIRDRPPLPLPHEIPKPAVAVETLPRKKPAPLTSTPSTFSLDSTSSNNTLPSTKKGKELPPPPVQGFKKGPPRPPKQIDEKSIPGSLRRPAMPAPASAPATAPASAKTSMQNAHTTESPMSELKNIFKRRNKGKDTPASSPDATLERKPLKEPPIVQAKPNTLTKSPLRQSPNIPNNPIVSQPNQMKLILPKIEASLKSPKPMLPKTVEPTSPFKLPPPVEKSSKPFAQNPVTQKAKLVQNLPIPKPESSKQWPPEPISSHQIASLPSRNQEFDKDFSVDTDDDEEWTYEQLGQYNIYNI